MISPGENLRRLQDEVYHRLLSESFLETVSIFRLRPGEVTEEQIQQALTALNTRGGKVGAAIVVMMPTGENASANNPGPMFDAVIITRVLVTPLFNDDAATGTLKSEDELALCVLHSLHHFRAGGLAGIMVADRETPMAPFTELIDVGTVGYDVMHGIKGWGLEGSDKVATPTISYAAGSVTLACATGGAAIYRTTDGSYPGSGNAAATLYTVPFAAGSGTALRVAAEHDNKTASDVLARTL